ncbi:MAG: MepB family protein [Crocinitomicaceae bacterium]
MDSHLNRIKTEVYDKCSLEISHFKKEREGAEYSACQFELNGSKVICRTSKITPKKVGQFVTFWKRSTEGITEPFKESDQIDFYVINATSKNRFGQFVFPKSVLIEKGILSTETKDGKRGFRVYPVWDEAQNKQAIKTQKWQLKYFFEMNLSTDLTKVSELYETQ